MFQSVGCSSCGPILNHVTICSALNLLLNQLNGGDWHIYLRYLFHLVANVFPRNGAVRRRLPGDDRRTLRETALRSELVDEESLEWFQFTSWCVQLKVFRVINPLRCIYSRTFRCSCAAAADRDTGDLSDCSASYFGIRTDAVLNREKTYTTCVRGSILLVSCRSYSNSIDVFVFCNIITFFHSTTKSCI